MNPVAGSAMTDRSGTIRIVWLGAMPGAFCQLGRDQTCDTPPPPAPPLAFHTVWVKGLAMEVTERPPTPVTKGCDAGSSTAGALETTPVQSEEPLSPEAAITVWPCAAICSKITCSAATAPVGSVSQSP